MSNDIHAKVAKSYRCLCMYSGKPSSQNQGADSGGEGKSKQAEKYVTKEK